LLRLGTWLPLVRRRELGFLKGFQHLFGPGAYGNVFGEVHPSDCPGGINEKLCRTRNVSAFGSCTWMQYIVTPNHFRFWIGEECVGVTKFLSLAPIDVRRVHANRDDLDPARFKFRKSILETPQLGVA